VSGYHFAFVICTICLIAGAGIAIVALQSGSETEQSLQAEGERKIA